MSRKYRDCTPNGVCTCHSEGGDGMTLASSMHPESPDNIKVHSCSCAFYACREKQMPRIHGNSVALTALCGQLSYYS